MYESNIVAGSNVFLSREDDPRWDAEFVAQIQDYSKLKDISSRRQVDNRVASFSGIQGLILKNEMRCVFAPKDPCWGISRSTNKEACACINKDCRHIFQCNPNYTDEEAAAWVMTDEERRLYGDPSKLPLYYIVDMIPEDEMLRYECNPLNDGLEFPIKTNPVIPDPVVKKDTNTYKINPVNGRKMVVIGHKWMITDNADFQNEELVPIWGYVDEVVEKQPVKRKKAKRIEKKEPERVIKKVEPVVAIEDPDYANKRQYETDVKSHICDAYKLTELTEDYFQGDINVILVDNPAEKSYVSSMLLLNEIEHGFSMSSKISIYVIDEYIADNASTIIMISSNVLKRGCKKDNTQIWKQLSKKNALYELSIPDREYYEYHCDGLSRWCCRNLYGVTHVVVDENDIADLVGVTDGAYDVSLVEDKNGYLILKKDGDVLGHLNIEFKNMINALKKSGDIEATPALIKGIKIIVKGSKKTVLGMGNLKFLEY